MHCALFKKIRGAKDLSVLGKHTRGGCFELKRISLHSRLRTPEDLKGLQEFEKRLASYSFTIPIYFQGLRDHNGNVVGVVVGMVVGVVVGIVVVTAVVLVVGTVVVTAVVEVVGADVVDTTVVVVVTTVVLVVGIVVVTAVVVVVVGETLKVTDTISSAFQPAKLVQDDPS